MSRTHAKRLTALLALFGLSFSGVTCTSGGLPAKGLPPSVSGTHTVMGRAYFPGGIMVLIDAHLLEGRPSGSMEYSQVQSRGEISLRVQVDVSCVGVFRDGTRAVVAGPVARVDGDYLGRIGVGDWLVIQVEEGGPEGDLILSRRDDRNRALRVCQQGPDGAGTLRALDGDLSIH